nr:guanine nucleotide-binding protein-like 1 [Leptinotarsa decemlineata]
MQVRRKRGRIRMAAEGTQQLFDICKKLVKDEVDLSSWQSKIKEELEEEYIDNDVENLEIGETVQLKNVDTHYQQYEKFNKGILTIGCVGQPNVGKSSLMNAVMGRKVVSVSKTPGHTKHFQTIFLTPNVRLCDCPGLVFPSKVPRPLQVLMGSYPIAQLRQPYITIKYLAERLDLVSMLRIEHPYQEDTWSAMDICDGWAKKRGYLTAKTAHFDSYRAANSLLRMALDGKICLCLRPPSYTENKEYWISHPEVKTVKWIQARSPEDEVTEKFVPYESDTSDCENIVGDDKVVGQDSDNEDEEDSECSEDSGDDEGNFIGTNKFAPLGPDE